jgi:hypothetical protein
VCRRRICVLLSLSLVQLVPVIGEYFDLGDSHSKIIAARVMWFQCPVPAHPTAVGLWQGWLVISVSLQPGGLEVRLSGSERILAWPEPDEILVPSEAVASAVSYPKLTELPNLRQVFWSWGRGFRTLPVLPGRWVFGRRTIQGAKFYCALRGPETPVLVVSTNNWQLDGVMASTGDASSLAQALSHGRAS